MTTLYDDAKARRNGLERLMDRIPGYRGFADRELRREVDQLEREHLAARLGEIKRALRDLARRHTDAASLGALSAFDRVERRLDGLSQAIRFADYGATGLFDAVKIVEDDLARLYDFDLSLLDDLDRLGETAAQVPSPGSGDAAAALDLLLAAVDALATKWAGRESLVSGVGR